MGATIGMRPPTLATAEILAANKPHGTRIRYMGGCRCLPCRASNSRYECARAVQRRLGLGSHLVPARASRCRLIELSRRGIGRRSVSNATGISETVLSKIKSGRRSQVRALTEKKILELRGNTPPRSAIVPATDAWTMIRKLMSEGFTKRELSNRLGYRSYIQFNPRRMTLRNVSKVRAFFRLIMAGGE